MIKMNFDPGYTNSTGNLSPLFGNSFSYAPSPYPESLYNIRSGPSSLANLSCCNSPGCSIVPNFSPESFTPSIINQNERHHPYRPPGSFMNIDNRRHEARNFYSSNNLISSTINDKRFHSRSNSPQSLKIHPNLCKRKFDDKSNISSNPKRMSHRNFKSTAIMPQRHFPARNIDIKSHKKYDHNSLFTPQSDKEVLMNVKQEKEYSKSHMINEPNCSLGKTYSSEKDMRTNTDNMKIRMHNPNGTDKINFVTGVAEDKNAESDFHSAPAINNFTNNHEGFGKDSIFEDTVTSATVSKFELNNIADLQNCQVSHITMPENSIFTVQDIQQHNVENTDLTNILYEPIFEGKDKNGEDIVILINNSDTQAVNVGNIIDTFTNNQSSESKDNQATLHSMTETTAVTCKASLESHIQENSIFNIQDTQQENIDLANYFFEPIFEGKGENGEDIVTLVGNSSIQEVDAINITDTSTNNQNVEKRDNQASLNTLAETPAVSSETFQESHVQEMNNETDTSMFLSHVDDYGAEETVTTSKKKCVRTKKINTKSNENRKENSLITKNKTAEANYTLNGFNSQPRTLKEDESTSTNTNQDVNTSNAKCNGKCKHPHFRKQLPVWRRRLMWKYNQPIIKMQRVYVRKFMKKVMYENEHIMVNENFWNMYRIIVTRIGGSVLQTMYNILPELIRNSGLTVQKSNNAASEQNKKRLQVKFPPKMKKQNNSEN